MLTKTEAIYIAKIADWKSPQDVVRGMNASYSMRMAGGIATVYSRLARKGFAEHRLAHCDKRKAKSEFKITEAGRRALAQQ